MRERSADKVVAQHNRGSNCISGMQGKRRTEPQSVEKSIISRFMVLYLKKKKVLLLNNKNTFETLPQGSSKKLKHCRCCIS